MYPGN